MNIQKTIQLAFQYYQAGDLAQAGRLCREVLRKQPNNADILHFLGVISYQLQNYDSAILHIKKSLQIKPTNSDAYYNLGRAFQKKGEPNDAIKYYQKAVQQNPYFIDAYLNIGNLFQETGKLDEAIINYQKATDIDPNFAGAHYNLGVVFQEKDQLNEAIAAYQKAIHLNPSYADAYHDLGYLLQMNGELDEAIRCYQKALEISPNLFDAYNNLGRAFQEQRKLDEAITSYQKALQINPDFADAHWNIALINLLKGNFIEGWKGYEWRWRLEGVSQRNFSQPLWDGTDIQGCTILLHAEQGFGDTIQFIRYASLVAERGAKVIVECQKELSSLLRNVGGVSEVIAKGGQLPEFDVHCPLLSLPLVFATTVQTIPATTPYLSTNSSSVKNWKDKIKRDDSKLRIGIIWSGNPKNIKLRYKSCSLNAFAPLAKLEGITFYSLQKGESAEQTKNPPEGIELIDYTEEIEDFSDTAALIENLDLVISVDTAAAHLAGALGKPIWTLLPYAADWRWLINRDDSPWYPTMRLFRQPSFRDWKSVIERICIELQKINSIDLKQ
jgi:tetratricopeptide (TPR) repeat protein